MSPLVNARFVSLRTAVSGLFAICLLSASALISVAQHRAPLEPAIASITTGRDTLDKVRSLYGQSVVRIAGDVRTLCYYVEADRAYLSVSSLQHEARVRQISLTTLADVAPGCQAAKVNGKHLTLLRGLVLGDSMGKVVAVLGPPSRTGKMPMPNHELVYTDYKIGAALLTLQYERDKLILAAVDASPE